MVGGCILSGNWELFDHYSLGPCDKSTLSHQYFIFVRPKSFTHTTKKPDRNTAYITFNVSTEPEVICIYTSLSRFPWKLIIRSVNISNIVNFMEFRGFPKQELNILWPLRYCISVFVQLWSCQCHVLIFYRILRKIKPILQIRLKIEDAQTSSFWFCLFSSGLAWFVFKQILHLTFYNPWILNMGVFIQNCHYQSIKAIIGIGRAIKMSTLSL